MSNRLFLDVHIVQTVPPSNLNRDDSGSPKSALYGGVRRARVSSQAWKRATRQAFVEQLPTADHATRTKKIAALLTGRLAQRCGLDAQQAGRIATALLAPLKIKPAQRKPDETSYLLFFGHNQLDEIVSLVEERVSDLVSLPDDDLAAAITDLPVIDQLKRGHPVDVALFGRMVADIPGLNVDAATQVAHALSTHATDIEFDYFTAVDDENTEDQTGAGMIGTVEFNSATLYRYATVGVHQLRANLTDGHATADAVALFLSAFARSMPTGHQNTFAHRTLPHLVLAALRTDQPVNLVSAFERPVPASHSGIADQSALQLAKEFSSVGETWGAVPTMSLATYACDDSVTGKLSDAFGPSIAFPQLVDRVQQAVATWLDNGTKP